jgi:hypothetical protein
MMSHYVCLTFPQGMSIFLSIIVAMFEVCLWSCVMLDNPTIARLLQIFAAFLEHQSPLLSSQEPVTDLRLEPHEPSPDPKVILMFSSILHLELPSLSIFRVFLPTAFNILTFPSHPPYLNYFYYIWRRVNVFKPIAMKLLQSPIIFSCLAGSILSSSLYQRPSFTHL